MQAGLFISGSRFEVLCDDEAVGPRRDLDGAAVAALAKFAERYAALRITAAEAAAAGLLSLGRDLYEWLDGDAGQLTQLRERAPRPFVFEIRGPRTPSDAQWALLRAPWELLADEKGFWVQDVLLTFSPVRRLGQPATPATIDDYRLGLAFMASAPRGQRELDYEAEETAILRAVGEGEVDLFVEESGDPEELGHRLRDLIAPMSALPPATATTPGSRGKLPRPRRVQF
jgi:hypothetical protein